MQEISAKIEKYRITSSNIHISEKVSKVRNLSVESKAMLKMPKDKENETVLLNVELNLRSADDEIRMNMVSDIIFELSQLPDDYNEVAEHELVPMARDLLLNLIDNMLEIMGYNKMGLAQKCKKTGETNPT